MIQDIAPHIYHNEYVKQVPKENDIFLDFDGDYILLKEDHSFFRYQDILDESSAYYLFRIDEISYFLTNLKQYPHTKVLKYELRHHHDHVFSFASITAWQIYHWRSVNQYCGCCGGKMIDDEHERALLCPSCHNLIYPRLNPAVIVGILNDQGQLLVTKYANGPYSNYALVAGFCEVGESVEQTVIREAKEETGLDVTELTYYKSQPWSFSETLLMGFFCRAHGNQTIHMQESELKVCEWTDSLEGMELPGEVSLTGEMMQLYKDGKIK